MTRVKINPVKPGLETLKAMDLFGPYKAQEAVSLVMVRTNDTRTPPRLFPSLQEAKDWMEMTGKAMYMNGNDFKYDIGGK